ncbi:hypothetical protein LC612_42390 [Nostoc sp. CHAB 5834]|nr:hypothetical protein [Nostoc sp. CHAB 5834]
MKTYLLIAAFSCLSIMTATAQDEAKLRRDVTYSTHNYKHPNKAAKARQWEAKQGVTVTTPMPNQGPMASYKHPVPGAVPVGGVVVPHTPERDVTLRNYKIQRVSAARPAAQFVMEATGKTQPQTISGND